MKKNLILVLSIFFLFSCSANKSQKYLTQFSTITTLVQEKNTEELKKIFSSKVELTNEQQEELLRNAITNKYENIILILIKNGMKVDYKIDGKTILYYAIKNGQYYFASQLIDLGANPFEKSEFGSELFISAMKTNYGILQKKVIDVMISNYSDMTAIDFSQGVYNLSSDLFEYLVDNVTKNYENNDIFTLTVRELLLNNQIDKAIDILNNERAFECLLNSKFTPYIVSENFNSQDDVGRIVNRLLGQKLIFSQNEPYIQNAIDNKHYDSIYWLVKNGANWKDNLIYFASNDNVLNYLYYKLKFVDDDVEKQKLTEFVKYFEAK